jgi:hypothetical protein
MTDLQVRQKYFGVPLQKAMPKDDGTVLVRGFFTSDKKDEVGDLITRGATEKAIGKYRQWGNIRYMHLPRPVAKVVRIGSSDGLEWNEVEILVVDPQAVFEVEHGLLKALSVGIFFGMDDFEIDEDGGWIINDYELAEISLVDHPANYDARLTSIDQMFKTLDRGRRAKLLEKLQESLEDEPVEEKEKDLEITQEEQIEQETTEVEDQIEEKVLDDDTEVEDEVEVIEVDKDLVEDEEEAEEETADEDLSLQASIDATEEDIVEEETEEEITEETYDLAKMVQDAVDEAMKEITSTLKAVAEVLEATERSTSEDEDEDLNVEELKVRITELEKVNSDLEKELDDLRKPVNRRGKVKNTDLPEDTEEDVQENDREEKSVGLRSAVKKYFETNRG